MNNEPLDPVMGLMLMVFVIVVPYIGYRIGKNTPEEELKARREKYAPFAKWFVFGVFILMVGFLIYKDTIGASEFMKKCKAACVRNYPHRYQSACEVECKHKEEWYIHNKNRARQIINELNE